MTEGPAEWLGAWATVGGTIVAALVAICAAVSSWLNHKKAKASADDAKAAADRSAEATERIAAAIEASEARSEAEQRVIWRAYRYQGDVRGTVFVLANKGKRAARGVQLQGIGPNGSSVQGWREAVDIEGESSRRFTIDMRGTIMLPELRVTWHENTDGEVVQIG